MEPTPSMNIKLWQRDCHFIIEGLRDLREKWFEINRTSTDEDIQAEFGMDALVLDITCQYFEREAVAVFGPSVLDFSRTPFPTGTSAPAAEPSLPPPSEKEESPSGS